MKCPRSILLLGSALFLTLAAQPALAQSSGRSWKEDREFSAKLELTNFRKLPVQEGGRRKPVDSFAREFVFKITDKKSFQGLDPVYMTLSMAYEFRDQWLTRRCICVRNLELIELFKKHGEFSQKRRAGDRFYVSIQDFQTNTKIQRIFRKGASKAQKSEPRNDLEKACFEIYDKTLMMKKLSQGIKIVPTSDKVDDPWTSIRNSDPSLFKDLQSTEVKFLSALRDPNPEKFNESIETFVKQMNAYDFKVYPYHGLLELEYTMNKYRPFQLAQLIYLLAILCYVAGYFKVKNARLLGFVTFTVAGLVHIGALTGRGFLVSRSPVASLYETLLFMTGFAAIMAWTLEIVYKRNGAFALGAAVVCLAGLFLGDHTDIYYDKQAINPLVPVLRSYWLNIHVSCMIASYGACLLAAAVGFVYLWRWCLGAGREASKSDSAAQYLAQGFFKNNAQIAKEQSMIDMDHYLYRSVQVGFLLLTVGIILGGVWANQSWGRYWDWDPKETWAFITWVVYAIYLHMRIAGVGRGPIAASMSLIGFWFVMFTYLGVSYVLPGLHSYVPAGKMDWGHMMPFIVSPFAFIGLFAAVAIAGVMLKGKTPETPAKA